MSKIVNSFLFAASLFLLLSGFLISSAYAQNTQKFILPDDGLKDASFADFRKQLLNAVQRHDKKFVEDILSPDVRMALGGGSGKEEFLEEWQQLLPVSLFWGRMQRVLAHGAQLDRESGEFNAPAISFDECGGDHILCTVWNKSKLHQAPNDTSAVIRNIYDEQVILLTPSESAPIKSTWAKVKTKDGKTGFIKSADIYSGYDEFATFKKVHQKWCLVWFGFAGL